MLLKGTLKTINHVNSKLIINLSVVGKILAVVPEKKPIKMPK